MVRGVLVFDNRVAVDHDLKRGSYDQCHACRMPITEQKKSICTTSRVFPVTTASTLTEEQRQRFAERQKQVSLTKERGEEHIGNAAQRLPKARAKKKAASEASRAQSKKSAS